MRKFVSIVTLAIIAVLPLRASAQILAGTDLVGNMTTPLDSGSAQIGQRFILNNVHSQDNNVNGATIYGHVSDVQHASQGRPGKIELAFDKLRTASGGSYALSGRATQVQTNTKNNALKEAGGAVAGLILGNVLGKAIGTNAGGLFGAAGGYLYAKNNRQNISIPQNAVVTVEVLRARRQTG